MTVLLVICICSVLTVTGITIGCVLADKHFWDRQEWASRIEGKF